MSFFKNLKFYSTSKSLRSILSEANLAKGMEKFKLDKKETGASPRAMKYPYTFSAKIAQFPLKFYINNQWVWRYYFISLLVSLPIFYKIHRMANSEQNVAQWKERKAREHAEHEEHEEHLD